MQSYEIDNKISFFPIVIISYINIGIPNRCEIKTNSSYNVALHVQYFKVAHLYLCKYNISAVY
jgi:hypothetical protein